jgi:SPW repeat-containing protein
MSTHFTRRGGTPASPESRPDESDRRREDARTRERRFDSARSEPSDVPVSPLVREQRDAEVRASAPIRDRAAVAPGAPATDWRSTVFTASGLTVVVGLWLIVAPFVLNYGLDDPVWNDVLFGGVVALLAIVRVAGAHRAEWLSWTIVLVGAWVFASALWLDDTMTAAVNDVVAGALIAVFGVASAMATHDGRRGETATGGHSSPR